MNSKRLKGTINLSKNTKVLYDVEYSKKYQSGKKPKLSNEYNPKYIFSLVTKERKYIFIAKVEQEMMCWMKEILNRIQTLPEEALDIKKRSISLFKTKLL
jgi:hypothetical protein